MFRSRSSSLAGLLVLLGFTGWFAGCTASFGPGYIVETQEVRVSFSPQDQPGIRILAEYRLKNTGNQPLDSLDVRLPGRRFRPDATQASWDGSPLARGVSPNNPRDTLLRFPQSWKIGQTRTLKFSYEIPSTPAQDDAIGFSSDAFYLPAGGWTPELLPARGVFGFGGVPPKKWQLMVQAPQGFLVHASGVAGKHSGKSAEVEFRFAQTVRDLNPFVVAGRYQETRQDLAQNQEMRVWSRGEWNPAELRQAGEALSQTIQTYDSLFGARARSRPPLWIVECPASSGCISASGSSYSAFLYGPMVSRAAALLSADTVLLDPRAAQGRLVASVGPALAAGWLGYGQNPGFYEQQPPMSALPAFAIALALESASGLQARDEIIRRSLAAIPESAQEASDNEPEVMRAKSLLLFYALRDRVGPDAFQKAMRHMLFARRGRGLDLAVLIAAIEQEAHQDVGPFVRQWIKRPGVPDDFRARFSQSTLRKESLAQEATQ